MLGAIPAPSPHLITKLTFRQITASWRGEY
jgi:hypothetical protein